MPYKAQFSLPAAAVSPLIFGQPSFSIIDPNATFPSNTPSTSLTQMFAYGNCETVDAYKTLNRSMRVFTNLGIQKQDTIIRKTNGSAAARELYDNPAGIVIYAQAPAREVSSLVGRFIYTLEYEFSGRRDPLGPESKVSAPGRDNDGDILMSP